MPICKKCKHEIHNYGDIDNYVHRNFFDKISHPNAENDVCTIDNCGCKNAVLFKEYDPVIEGAPRPDLTLYYEKVLAQDYNMTPTDFADLQQSDEKEWNRIRKVIYNKWTDDADVGDIVKKLDTSCYDKNRRDVRIKNA